MSSFKHIRSNFFRNKGSKAGLILLGVVLVIMVLGITLDPRSPTAIGPQNRPPSLAYPFGTDFRGHDLFSQIAWGSYASLSLSFYSAVGGTLLGFISGILSGYYRKLEPVISGATDVVLCFPHIPLLVVIALIFPANNSILVLVLILVMWGPVSRAIRAQTLAVKKLSFVDSVRMSGMRDIKIIWKVISQEVASIGLAYFIINLSIAIVVITSLEFVGIGNPLAVNWGSILYWAQQYAFGYGDWWWVIAPGIIISLVATGFALIGLSFEEMMNPRLRV